MIASPSRCRAGSPASAFRDVRKDPPADHPSRLRVLVAYEDEYRAYREAIVATIGTLRPHIEVVNAAPGELEVMAPRADLVICSRSDLQHAEGTLAWIELPNEPELPARIYLQGRCSEVTNLTLDGLLAVVDTVEEQLLA
jgi:hypothetical protein